MLKKDNFDKVLEEFFNNPLPDGIGFQLREISRNIKLAPKSVKLYLDELEKVDLIILDLIMPKMGGEEFLEELRNKRKSTIPVILSSVDNATATRMWTETEVQGVFFKMGNMNDLLDLMYDNLFHCISKSPGLNLRK